MFFFCYIMIAYMMFCLHFFGGVAQDFFFFPPLGFEFPDRRLTDEHFALPISHTSGREMTQDQCDYVDSMFCSPLSRLTSWLVRGPLGLVTHCQTNA